MGMLLSKKSYSKWSYGHHQYSTLSLYAYRGTWFSTATEWLMGGVPGSERFAGFEA